MDAIDLRQKLEQIEEQARLTIAEYPKTLTKERQRMIIALVRYVRSELDEITQPASLEGDDAFLDGEAH
jgi:hypothetical protein